MGLLQKINAVWQKIGVVQRALLVAIVMACAITAALLTKWASAPEMTLLYGDLPLEEVDQIVGKLQDQDVPYELRRGGRSIYVPAEKVLELRARLAGEGLPAGGEAGYKLFDNEKIGVSPLVQQMNYTRAIQDELARTIQMIEGVLAARVHIVRPEQTIFTSTAKEATASVTLRLKPGWRMTNASIAAITNLVANATDGLKPENVTIVDTQGRLLSSNASASGTIHGANTFMDYKQRVESEIAAKVQEMLDLVLGPGRASIKVSAKLDMTSQTVQMTTYEKGHPVEEVINTTSTIKEGGTTADGKPASPASTDKQETTELTYKLPETITQRTDVPGKIVSVSVAAVVDLSAEPAGDSGTEGTSTEPTASRKLMTVEDVEEIIRNAVGPDLLVDEKALTVKDVPFHRPIVPATEADMRYEKLSRYIEIARQSSMGVLAVCALIALKIFTGARRKLSVEAAALAPAGGGEGWPMLPGGQADMSPQATVRNQITAALQKNPEQVKQLFASWLAEDK
ncbi:MAG TPA: flagellar basal-body MS-ring/collar protein FliF [Anaerohalosphaeraceae bacterium]|jgi:flagellar M-ring protein FliF|nr:flagellar basal-body MS-ring/collar protein FliF [Anaerohalosphaeraceae bacterium]HRT49438.1 flagellar basal-body MS-ring/collar protein FliF [Anaerohalosphaeraceae bacterium]HRT85398.1 flagellar basal-body MS-ring/collar protein FliF [Anaerohalosphaeraceae bacterium]